VDSDLKAASSVNVQVLAGLLFTVALVAAIWFTARRRRLYPIAFGLLWFLVTLLPTSIYPLAEVENDHRMFFCYPGLILAVVWSAWLLWQRLFSVEQREKLRPAVMAVAVMVLCAYGYGVRQRNIVWHTAESLWLDDVEKSPTNGRGLMNYALTQMAVGRYPRALDYFSRALEYAPNYPTLEINLGIVNGAMADQGDATRTAEAERHFLRAIALAPDADEAHAFYGRWLLQHGRTQEAIAQLRTAIALDPPRPMQHELLIQAESKSGDLSAARQAATETLAVAPDDAVALQALQTPATATVPAAQDADFWVNESLRLYQSAQYEASIAAARKAVAINPGYAAAWNNIAAGEASLHHWDEAIAAAQKAVALQPDFQLAKNNLAWAQSQKKLGVQ